VRRLCDFGALHLFERIDALALVVESVHQMHVCGVDSSDGKGRRSESVGRRNSQIAKAVVQKEEEEAFAGREGGTGPCICGYQLLSIHFIPL
jgi:hypothetical protein